MRSLTILTHDVRVVKGKKPEARYTGLTIRPEELEGITSGQGETVYVASERPLPDGGVEVQVFISNVPKNYDSTVSFPLLLFLSSHCMKADGIKKSSIAKCSITYCSL